MFRQDGSSKIIETLNESKKRTNNEIAKIEQTLNDNGRIVAQLIQRGILTENDKKILQDKGLFLDGHELEVKKDENVINKNDNSNFLKNNNEKEQQDGDER